MPKSLLVFLLFLAITVITIMICYLYIEKTDYNKNIAILETNNNIQKEDIIKENYYIDIWRDISLDIDITLHSSKYGTSEKLYLGVQPLHYLINKNGEVHTYQASSFQNIITGERDPAIVKYIKTLKQSELQKLENDLNLIIKNNGNNSINYNSTYWYIKINDNTTKVNVDVQTNILDNYL